MFLFHSINKFSEKFCRRVSRRRKLFIAFSVSPWEKTGGSQPFFFFFLLPFNFLLLPCSVRKFAMDTPRAAISYPSDLLHKWFSSAYPALSRSASISAVNYYFFGLLQEVYTTEFSRHMEKLKRNVTYRYLTN